MFFQRFGARKGGAFPQLPSVIRARVTACGSRVGKLLQQRKTWKMEGMMLEIPGIVPQARKEKRQQ